VPLFDYLAQHPEDASLFSEAMVGFNSQEPPAVAAAYDFSTFSIVVDVGGATGNMLAAIFTRHAGPRGVLFDRPHVVADAPALLEAKGVSDRVTIESGDFFKTVPAGGDAYLLSHIIHDWSEDQCGTILGHVRKAMNPAGRLLVVEMVLPEGDAPHPGKLLDIGMLVATGGQERTEPEYRGLLNSITTCPGTTEMMAIDRTSVGYLILVVDDEPDVEVLFRQQFRRDLRAARFVMEFAQSAPAALQRIGDAEGVSLILILSDINMPGMTGLELLPKAKAHLSTIPVDPGMSAVGLSSD
jgi:CheY-like chemotaxis protein